MSYMPHRERPSLRAVPSPVRKQTEPCAGLNRARIIHIINDLNIGGAEMMLYKLLSEVDRARFEPIVISLRKRGQLQTHLETLNVPVFSVAMKLPLPTPTSCWRLI